MNASWIFDPLPASRSRKGGLANTQIFEPSLDSFVREVLQNSRDQRRTEESTVRVRFTVRELSETVREEFLDSMGWSELEPHIENAADPKLVTIGPRLREGLTELQGGLFRVLSIQDEGTKGLTGGEDDDSNFAALCRHELITSHERHESGGSFGIGKSVLWRFSALSTALFYSIPHDDPEGRGRFIGRTVLPAHAVDGQDWEGSGWFGCPDTIGHETRAISVRGPEADALARATWLDRVPGRTGTSILVVGFDEPVLERERSLEQLCGALQEAATKWFWPALHQGDLEVTVEGWRDDEKVFTGDAHAELSAVGPFTASVEATAVGDALEEPGDIVEREVRVQIPRRTLEDRPSPPVEATARLRLRLASPVETDLENTVALQRGSGMVVAYRAIKAALSPEQRFHAVLLAGKAAGSSAEDAALEQFLRAAEPPAHHEWTHTTERIDAEYAQGSRKALLQLFDQIENHVRDLTSEPVEETDDGPDALKKLFALPGVGASPPPPESFRLSDAIASLEGGTWRFSGTYTRAQEGDEPWSFRLALLLDQEGSGPLQPLRLNRCEISGSAALDLTKDGASVRVPGGTNRVSFSGDATPVEVPSAAAERVRVLLQVDAQDWDDA